MIHDFYIGQEVRFKTRVLTVPKYFVPNIDEDGYSLIKHGDTYFKENKGTVMYVGTQYIFVEYNDIRDNRVCLGFLPDELIPITNNATPNQKGEITMQNPLVDKVFAQNKLEEVRLIEKHIVPNLRNVLDELILTANKDAILKMAQEMEAIEIGG